MTRTTELRFWRLSFRFREFLRADQGRNELAVCLLTAAAYLLVWPVGNYAIMDDWAYAKSLEHLHFDGDLKILDWNPMSLVGHVFWGALFTKLFGFSLTITKLSVVAMHAIGCVALLRLLAFCGVGANLALAAVAALFFNPLYFVHVFMYMTDVPAVAWQVVTVFCYLKGLSVTDRAATVREQFSKELSKSHTAPSRSRLDFQKAGGAFWLICGSLAAGEAFLIRQNAVLVPAAVLLYLMLFARRQCTVRVCLASFGPVALIVGGFTYWYQRIHGPTSTYTNSLRNTIEFITHPPLEDLPFIAFSFFVYIGWFLMPLAATVPIRAHWCRSRWGVVGLSCSAWLAVNALVWYAFTGDRIFPYIWNVVTPFGLFNSDEFLIGDRQLLWGKPVGLAIGMISVLAALAFLRSLWLPETPPCAGSVGGALLASFTSDPSDELSGEWVKSRAAAAAAKRLLLILLALQLAYVFATAPFLFDRHLLLFAPTVIALFCLGYRELAVRGAAVPAAPEQSGGLQHKYAGSAHLRALPCLAFLAVLGWYSVATTHDLHSLSRAAFAAGNELIAEGIDPRHINAGYAFDGWYTYESRSGALEMGPSSPPAWCRADVWRDRFERPTASSDAAVDLRTQTWWVGRTSAPLETLYAVTCSPPRPAVDGSLRYRPYREYHYQNWWPWRVNALYVLRDSRQD